MSSARAAREREREQRRGKGSRESRERGERQRGLRAYPDASGRLGGKQEVARAASALATELLRCEGRKTTGKRVGWAALEELGQVSGRQVSGWASLFLYFCSVFYLIATEFKFKQI